MVKRIVVGAHYGLGSWLAQRITALVMAAYTVLLAVALLASGPLDYAGWTALFSGGWMRLATLIFFVSLAWHAWVGARDIVMDYVKPDGLRLALYVLVILLLAGYIGWAAQILWR
jgi:succinate dehydrogenase / fumarate reductase, membrane anchor subunit